MQRLGRTLRPRYEVLFVRFKPGSAGDLDDLAGEDHGGAEGVNGMSTDTQPQQQPCPPPQPNPSCYAPETNPHNAPTRTPNPHHPTRSLLACTLTSHFLQLAITSTPRIQYAIAKDKAGVEDASSSASISKRLQLLKESKTVNNHGERSHTSSFAV
ncbi:hypothetical protein BDQ17DRAFT_1429055 [Cyathus striatus]|nr:hypothetical protein BDQ17DRAFT_1429055 [Cyathus striatus]